MARPRILGGTARGQALETPRRGTRPSPARLREALFDVLQFRERGPFLDLFAGSGAVGLEAASRGFPAVCVEKNAAAARVLRANVRRLHLPVEVVQGDALQVARERPGHFEVVFAAPPYPQDLPAVFQAILDGGAARPGGLYVLQHPAHLDPPLALAGAPVEARHKRYGSNALTFVAAPQSGPRNGAEGVLE